MGAVLTAQDERRFWAKVRVGDGLLKWVGTHNELGYGQFSVKGRYHKAHRIAYELLVGPIPVGMELDHLCRETDCINPDHLEPVTHRVNMLRGLTVFARNAQATHCPQGHAYDAANTYVHPRRLQRNCRKCRADRERARQLRFRAAS